VNNPVLDRLDELERQLHGIQSEVEVLRDVVRRAAPAPVAPPVAAPRPVPPTPAAVPRPSNRVPRTPRRELDLDALLSAKALAWAGGIVTVLGVVFLFVLAVDRGWIGHGVRIGIGAFVAGALFAGGIELRRRHGQLWSSSAAVGAGIAGAYATLLAAAGLYDFVPQSVGLVVAAAIAAAGVAVAVSWSSQTIGAIGLLGAMALPVILLVDTNGPSRLANAFVVMLLAATAVVSVTRRWRALLGCGAGLAGGQLLALFADEQRPAWELVTLAAAAWAMYLGTGVAWQLRGAAQRIGGTTSTFVFGSAGFALVSGWLLWIDDPSADRGIAALSFAAVYAAAGAALYKRQRDLFALLAVVGLAVGAIGVADVFSNGGLTYAWAAEAAALAYLARRLREQRFQLAAIAYLGLAAVHAFATEAPLERLFEPTRHPADGLASLLAVAVGAAAVAWTARGQQAEEQRGVFRALEPLLAGLRALAPAVRLTALTAMGLVLADAAGRATLALFQSAWNGGVATAFAHGQVAVTGLWSAAALAVALAGLRLKHRALTGVALGWLAVVLAKADGFDTNLTERLWPQSFALVAVASLAIAVALERRRDVLMLGSQFAYGLAAIAAGLGIAAGHGLFAGRLEGVAILAVAIVYGVLAAFFFGPKHRDFSSVLSALALVAAAIAVAKLVEGQAIVVLWAAAGAALAWLAHAIGERRFQLGAFASGALALATALIEHAPPSDLVRAAVHPGRGLPSIAAVTAALVALALAARPPRTESRDGLDRALDEHEPRWRSLLGIAAGALGLYGLSLAILEVAERIGPYDTAARFQNGHTAVSAAWGILGLAALTFGAQRRRRSLRLGGFALLGISLVKLFLYDLAWLSSIARALSFLAVGAMLLAGGAVYQRVTDEREVA
jgi:uncharacterized membrane protein